MAKTKQIQHIDPPAGISGGEVIIEVSGSNGKDGQPLQAWFGDQQGHFVAATRSRALVLVPEYGNGAESGVSSEGNGKSRSAVQCIGGRRLAGDSQTVAEPAFAP